jgi:uncharacterized protein YndB with AHSA1/START domain
LVGSAHANPVCEVDFRIGGKWHIVMRGPDGSDYPCGGVYREIVKGEKLVFTNIATDKEGSPILDGLTTVTFADEGAKTKLTLHTRATAVVGYAAEYLKGMEAGWTQSLEKLGDELFSDRAIVATRIFDAPRELVFEMWTSAEHIRNWYGPKGFSLTTHEMDVRPGGVWRFVMHGPDGKDYDNKIVYVEIAKPERLVYDHVVYPLFQSTTSFFDLRGKTLVSVRMVFESAELRNKIAKEHGAVEGLTQTLERLSDELSKTFSISRVFDAPRDLVWKAVTESERLAHWWGPKGFTMVKCTVDLRPGGLFHYCMRSPDGHEMWGKWVYREIDPPDRLVAVTSFSDAEGNILRHPMSASWPREVLNTMTLTERDGKTTMTIAGGPINATEEERKTFGSSHSSMEQGFKGTLDQLEAYLEASRGASC